VEKQAVSLRSVLQTLRQFVRPASWWLELFPCNGTFHLKFDWDVWWEMLEDWWSSTGPKGWGATTWRAKKQLWVSAYQKSCPLCHSPGLHKINTELLENEAAFLLLWGFNARAVARWVGFLLGFFPFRKKTFCKFVTEIYRSQYLKMGLSITPGTCTLKILTNPWK